MVVANRLTEDPDGMYRSAVCGRRMLMVLLVNVLVVEAGDLDNYEDSIIYPFKKGGKLPSTYDWNLFTAPQVHLDGNPRPYDLGKGIGGGSLIGGMCWTRGGRADYDAWVELGNEGWGWEDLLPYFKKAENYTNNVDADFSHELYINPNATTYGTEGIILLVAIPAQPITDTSSRLRPDRLSGVLLQSVSALP